MTFDDLKNACDAFVFSEYFSCIALTYPDKLSLVFPQHSPSILLVCSFSIPPVFLEYFPSIALVFL